MEQAENMENIVIVMHPLTKEVIEVDTVEEPKWQSKYLHRSTGLPFETGMEMVATSLDNVPVHVTPPSVPTAVVDPDAVVETYEMKSIETLREIYERVNGKAVPSNKKNDKEWIISKLNG